MDPILAQALSTLMGAITTAILMASAYYWGPRQRQERADERDNRDEWAAEDTARRRDRNAADADRRVRRHRIREVTDEE